MPEQRKLVDFKKIKTQISLEQILKHYEVYGSLTPHSKVDGQYIGACPLCGHARKNPFKADCRNNQWHCFACRRGGNILDFVSFKENITIVKAAQEIASAFKLDAEWEQAPTRNAP